MATKKVGSTGRYGVRYGRKPKMVIKNLEAKQRQKQTCPYCERETVKRIASGIWQCKKCNAKFAGAAYLPKSSIKVVVGAREEEEAPQMVEEAPEEVEQKEEE